MPRLFMLAAVLLLPFLPLAPLSALADQVDGTPVDRVGTGATIASFENGLAAYLKGDYLKAVDLFRLTATEGNAAARYYLGMAYEQGQGVAQDYSAATKRYQLAAEQGNAQAQYRLGALYEYGTGVIQDYERAFMWFDLSSASGKRLWCYAAPACCEENDSRTDRGREADGARLPAAPSRRLRLTRCRFGWRSKWRAGFRNTGPSS